MSELILIRHGETALAGTFCGHSDPELNERGRAQATEIAEALTRVPIARIYSSDLRRAAQTAEVLARAQGVERRSMPGLREINFGRWDGLRWSEIEAQDADYAARWMAEFPHLPAPGGEVFATFEARVLACVELILCDASTPVAIISHGGVMRVVLELCFGISRDEAWARTRAYGCIVRLPLDRRTELALTQELWIDESNEIRSARQ